MSEELAQILIKERDRQAANRLFYGNTYHDNDFVCVYDDGQPIRCAFLSHRFQKVVKQLGFNGIHLHSLRHTAATLMANSGTVNLRTVQNYLGHSDITSTAIYVHPDMKAKKEASAVLEGIIGASETA